MAEFQEGQQVQLISGGPIMTVHEVPDEEMVVCRWFADNNMKQEAFKATTLKEWKPRGPEVIQDVRGRRRY